MTKLKQNSPEYEHIKKSYEIQKKLATRLKNSTPEERTHLYTKLYDEYHENVPDNPTLQKRKNPLSEKKSLIVQMRFLKRFLRDDAIVIELGPGSCAFSLEIAKHVKKIYAIDVSKEITKNFDYTNNFEILIYNGCTIPLPEESVDLAYSHQLMEHIHPDDAYSQLHSIYKTLKSGGKYVCITPNCLSGPHDISKYFDNYATGFHLKEYTYSALLKLFKEVGFAQNNLYIGVKGFKIKFPSCLLIACEKIFSCIPVDIRKHITRRVPFRQILGITIVGIK